MTLPANIRVNVSAPFPALVMGGAGIGVTKTNGVWTISLLSGQLVSVMVAAGVVPTFTGIALLDFGAFPGATDALLTISGQAGIIAGSIVDAWISPAATVDHSIDEHWADPPQVSAGNIVPGTGFTIYGATANGQVGTITDLKYGKWNVLWRWQ